MPVPGLFDITIFLEHIDQAKADAVEAAVRSVWDPIHTGWSAKRFDEGLLEMSAIGYVFGGQYDPDPDQLVARMREAIIAANGRACRVDFHVDEVLTVPGTEYVFDPRGKLTKSSLWEAQQKAKSAVQRS